MSIISHLTGTDEDVRRVEDVVRKHPLPDYITGFDVEFGEFDGDPAMWVRFKMRDSGPPSAARIEELRSHFNEMNALAMAVRMDLLRLGLDHWPYIRFTSALSGISTQTP